MNMFRRFLYRDSSYSTELFNERSFYKAFSRDYKTAKHEVLIESPYVTVRRASELASISSHLVNRGVAIILYTRNPEHHDGILRLQAYEGIAILKKVGIQIVVCNDMRHRKIAVIDRNILWEGSLNMLSQSNSKEVMRRTYSQELSEQMLKFTGLLRHNDARVRL